jgi:hypothetical protein
MKCGAERYFSPGAYYKWTLERFEGALVYKVRGMEHEALSLWICYSVKTFALQKKLVSFFPSLILILVPCFI